MGPGAILPACAGANEVSALANAQCGIVGTESEREVVAA